MEATFHIIDIESRVKGKLMGQWRASELTAQSIIEKRNHQSRLEVV